EAKSSPAPQAKSSPSPRERRSSSPLKHAAPVRYVPSAPRPSRDEDEGLPLLLTSPVSGDFVLSNAAHRGVLSCDSAPPSSTPLPTSPPAKATALAIAVRER